MNRRRFLAAGAAALPFWRSAFAQQQAYPHLGRTLRRAPKLVRNALTTPNLGFPAVVPLFSGVFIPSNSAAQLLRTESWGDFVEKAQQMARSYRLSCFTGIQNLNRTWYYGAFQAGPANYFTLQTPDSKTFMGAFTSHQTSYTLVDFNVSWQAGQLLYSGFWIAANTPATQLLSLDLSSFDDLSSQATQYSSAQVPMEMTRVQAYPLAANAGFAALYQAGKGTGIVHDMDFTDFLSEVGTLSGNTLLGLGYNPVEGHLTGAWQSQITGAEFFVDQTWDALVLMAQSGSGTLATVAVYPDAPSFDDYFEANLAPYVMGYGYAVAKGGQIIASGGGYARSPHEAQNPSLAYSADSRMTLASVSKAITGVALETLVLQKGISFDDPFLSLLNGKANSPYPGVGAITLRHLATMQSGLFQETNEGPADVPQGEDIWTEINNYLALPPAGPPGVSYYYDNTNYAILQGVIEEQSGTDYLTYVTQNVLIPAGIDPTIMNAAPALSGVPPTLIYASPTDANPGSQLGQFKLVGVSGWVSSARELVKLMAALRGSLLPQSAVGEMFADNIGWNLPGNPASGPAPYYGNFGVYYWKEGGLTSPSNQSLQTFLVRLGEGYDLALLINSPTPSTRSIDSICFEAFDARGLSTANLPPGEPLIQAAVQGASYQSMAAPGSYVAIIGSGFTSQPATDWSDAIGPDGDLPIELAGVQVRVGSVNAYVEYVSAGQVNVLLPASVSEAIANIELTTPDGGYTSSVQIASVAPGLFTYALKSKSYAAAIFGGTVGTIYVAAAGAIAGETSRPAQAGDAIALYGTGIGPTDPAWPDGMVLDQAYPAVDVTAFRVSIGGVQAPVTYAGMVDAGLFQINITMPTRLSAGDQAVVVSVHGIASQQNVFLTLA